MDAKNLRTKESKQVCASATHLKVAQKTAIAEDRANGLAAMDLANYSEARMAAAGYR